MKNIKQVILSIALIIGIAGLATPSTVGAVDVFQPCAGNTDSAVCKDQGDKAGDIIKPIINTLLYILGAISVIMIIIAGIRYTTSNGDTSAVTGAKNTLFYAIIGLIVAILAYAIVNFVIGALTPKPTPAAGTTAVL